MKYWWVNHKQTFKQELGEGYIWSPKTKKGGAKNIYYDNLTRAKEKDVIYSFAQGEIKAVGLIAKRAQESPKPDFGSAGERWDDIGWRVQVEWQMLEKPFTPKTEIEIIRPLLPEKYSPLKPSGNGNECYLTEISKELAELIDRFIEASNSNLKSSLVDLNINIEEENELERLDKEKIPVTQREQLTKARVGQGIFRSRVEQKEKCCRLTGITDKRFLIASHIKPWKDSTDSEKLEGYNGLLLSPHVDKLFDKGYISFSDEGEILCANDEVKELMRIWGLDPNKNVGRFSDKQKQYLKYHRDKILEEKLKASKV